MKQVIDLGFRPRPWQAECFRSFKRFSVVVVHRRGGKTVMAIMRLIDAALRCPHNNGRYAYVAPMLKQAKGIAWDYLQSYARQVPGTIINQGELWVEFPNGVKVRLYGADNPDGLRGLYFDGVVIDEVAQIRPELWGEVLLPTLADRKGWALFIGTPKGVNLFSQLYYKAVDDPEWFAKLFNYTQTQALPVEEVQQLERESTPAQFRQEMLCDFTASSDNTLIPIDLVIEATKRDVQPRLYEFAPKILGIDVAWEGGDRSVMFPRQGLKAFPPISIPGIPEKAFAARIAVKIEEWRPDAVFVDTTGGYGGEVVSRLKDMRYTATPVVFSWKASSDRFANIRSEMWFKMAAWIKDGGQVPNDSRLTTELCAPIYSNDNASARLALESKDDIRSRIGVSPDLADALALTFAFPVAQKPLRVETKRSYAGQWS